MRVRLAGASRLGCQALSIYFIVDKKPITALLVRFSIFVDCQLIGKSLLQRRFLSTYDKLQGCLGFKYTMIAIEGSRPKSVAACVVFESKLCRETSMLRLVIGLVRRQVLVSLVFVKLGRPRKAGLTQENSDLLLQSHKHTRGDNNMLYFAKSLSVASSVVNRSYFLQVRVHASYTRLCTSVEPVVVVSYPIIHEHGPSPVPVRLARLQKILPVLLDRVIVVG